VSARPRSAPGPIFGCGMGLRYDLATMSNLSFGEKHKLEKLFGMSSGYVLEFSNRTFRDFVYDSTGKNIFEEAYNRGSGSKANRLREFWQKEPNQLVGKLISDLLDYSDAGTSDPIRDQCRRIADRLLRGAPVRDVGASALNTVATDRDTSRTESARRSNDTLRVFLCHASTDKGRVRQLSAQLRKVGIDPWLDEEKLLPGQDWRMEIAKALRDTHAVVVCLSQQSVTRAGYVQKEIVSALDIADEQPEGAIFIVPVKLEECDVPQRLSRWHWVHLDEKGFDRLVDTLRKRAESLGIQW
jgi:hypothetical protein